jgi:hypothetical protein
MKIIRNIIKFVANVKTQELKSSLSNLETTYTIRNQYILTFILQVYVNFQDHSILYRK